LLFWVASWIERPLSLNSPHADVVLWLNAGIKYFGFCLSYRILFRSGRDVSSRRSPLARILWRKPQCAAVVHRCLGEVLGVVEFGATASRNPGDLFRLAH
jgi:hypothetical protein